MGILPGYQATFEFAFFGGVWIRIKTEMRRNLPLLEAIQMGMIEKCWLPSNEICRIEVLKDEMVTKLLVSYLLIFSALAIISFEELQTNWMGSKFWIIHFMSVKETNTYDICWACVIHLTGVVWGELLMVFFGLHVMPTRMFAGDVQHRLSWHTSGATNQLICFFPLHKFHNQQIFILGRTSDDTGEHVTLFFVLQQRLLCMLFCLLWCNAFCPPTIHSLLSSFMSISPSSSPSCKVPWLPGWSVVS